jgi:DNA-binding transcriptional MerR regulator
MSSSSAEAAFESDSESVSDAERASEEIFAKSADAFRTIGEAASELGLKTHVLRFWETKFDNLKPMKRPDGRRYYRPDDMEMLRKLQNLLHVQGLTIRGAVKALEDGEEPGPAQVEDGADDMATTNASVRDLQQAVREAVDRGDFREPEVQANGAAKARLESLLSDLTNLKSRLDAVRTAA